MKKEVIEEEATGEYWYTQEIIFFHMNEIASGH